MVKAKQQGMVLLSGGIDSPVAAHMVKKMGYSVMAIHFAHEAFTSEEPTVKAKRLAKKLKIKKMYVVDVNDAFAKLASDAQHRLYFVLQKRLMLRTAELVAHKAGCSFLVTGENLGQVSSQTLFNLSVIEKAVKIPVLRPLLTYEKNGIVKIAQEIRTFPISAGPEHCDALGPDHPRTRANLEEVLAEEERLDVGALVEKCAAGAKLVKL